MRPDGDLHYLSDNAGREPTSQVRRMCDLQFHGPRRMRAVRVFGHGGLRRTAAMDQLRHGCGRIRFVTGAGLV